jgi:hypothetical protein
MDNEDYDLSWGSEDSEQENEPKPVMTIEERVRQHKQLRQAQEEEARRRDDEQNMPESREKSLISDVQTVMSAIITRATRMRVVARLLRIEVGLPVDVCCMIRDFVPREVAVVVGGHVRAGAGLPNRATDTVQLRDTSKSGSTPWLLSRIATRTAPDDDDLGAGLVVPLNYRVCYAVCDTMTFALWYKSEAHLKLCDGCRAHRGNYGSAHCCCLCSRLFAKDNNTGVWRELQSPHGECVTDFGFVVHQGGLWLIGGLHYGDHFLGTKCKC